MADISGNTLVMAIQVVDQKVTALKQQIDKLDEDDDALIDLEDLLLSYMTAAHELRVGYESALKVQGDLPAYSDLVKS